jgi:hypothetical protein
MLPKRYEPLGRLNVVCPYYTMFPLEFPYTILKSAPTQSLIFDPFCGRGTTLYAARLLGLESVGVDSNPVAAAIAAAKLSNVTSESIIALSQNIFQRSCSQVDVPEGEFWHWCYHPDTLLEVCILRDFLLKRHSTDEEIALRALMLGILHGPQSKGHASYLSNQMPRTYATKPDPAVEFWEARRMRPRRVDTLDLIRRRAKYIFERVPNRVRGRVIRGDIRRISLQWQRRFTHVITSPPYLGMRCYVPDQWLRNWFLGADETVTYDESEQLGRGTRESFVRQLAAVWKRVSNVCAAGARLVIRFGALPSFVEDPTQVVKNSLAQSDAAWQIVTARHIAPPPKARRQAHQFARELSTALNEVDVYAVLEA